LAARIGESCGNWRLLGIARAIGSLFLARVPSDLTKSLKRRENALAFALQIVRRTKIYWIGESDKI